MANNITGNPWYIDTVGYVYNNPVYIKNLVWQAPVTGATLEIRDNQGREIVKMTSNTSDPTLSLGAFQWVQGFNVISLSSGNLSVVIHK